MGVGFQLGAAIQFVPQFGASLSYVDLNNKADSNFGDVNLSLYGLEFNLYGTF